MKHTLRSLRHRNYRLFFFGQFISMTGTWMQGTAQMWLVYRLTHSSFLLGLVGFAGQIPILVFGLWGGAIADRYDRRRLLLITQILSQIQALTLAALMLTGTIEVWHIFILAMLLGVVNAFDMPARQAFVSELVPREDLGNAIALNSFLVNSSRIVGPVLAGILVGAFGEGICFLFNGLSYCAVIASLVMMRVEGAPHPRGGTSLGTWPFIREGLVYVTSRPTLRLPLAIAGVLSIAGMPFMVLMPLFAQDILGKGAQGLGLLMGAFGVGAILGALLLAGRESIEGLRRVVGMSAVFFGIALVLFSASTLFLLSLAFMVLTGFGMMMAFAGANTLLQTATSDAMRGRVMSLYGMTFMGLAPFGSLLAGIGASHLGAPATVALGGLACIFGGGAFIRHVLTLPGGRVSHAA